jgi:hypothetical protein
MATAPVQKSASTSTNKKEGQLLGILQQWGWGSFSLSFRFPARLCLKQFLWYRFLGALEP